MSTAIQIVENFCRSWEAPHFWRHSLARDFTEDCVYENVGVSLTHGPAEAAAFFEGFSAQMGLATVGVDMLAICAVGDKVLTERVDYLRNAEGATVMTLRLMGIFELRDGRICAWRDYFDTLPFAPK